MAIMKLTLVALGVLVSLACCNAANHQVFCSYNAGSQFRTGLGKFKPLDLDDRKPHLCTHMLYNFAGITGLELTQLFTNENTELGLYNQIFYMRQRLNGDLKVILSVGGWNLGSDEFQVVVKTWTSRNTFAKNVVKYLKRYGFDGLNVDWEFPSGGDTWKFTDLLKQLQTEFTKEHQSPYTDKLLLTMSAAAGSYYINQAYETELVVQEVDFLLLLSYNYHGDWDGKTGHHTALYPSRSEWGSARELNIDWSVNFWLNQGLPKEKLILGLSAFGRTFTLSSPYTNGVGAPTKCGGQAGPYTQEAGILAYYEVCENLQKKNWNKRYLQDQQSPYAFKGDQWVGYDDTQSIAIKAQYARDQGLGGVMFWSIDLDDFSGSCGEGRFPLLRTVSDIVTKGNFYGYDSTGDGIPDTAYPKKNPEFKCTSAGNHVDPYECRTFYSCTAVNNGFLYYTASQIACPGPMFFNKDTKQCDMTRNC